MAFIDHEQSLGWKNDPGDAARNRIAAPANELAQVAVRCNKFGRKYQWARAVSSLEEREMAFTAIELEPGMMDAAKPWIPPHWFPDAEFAVRKASLAAWWAFLRAQPYANLDSRIFG